MKAFVGVVVFEVKVLPGAGKWEVRCMRVRVGMHTNSEDSSAWCFDSHGIINYRVPVSLAAQKFYHFKFGSASSSSSSFSVHVKPIQND